MNSSITTIFKRAGGAPSVNQSVQLISGRQKVDGGISDQDAYQTHASTFTCS